MRVFGLIGFPLSHSFSASFFAEKFKRENILDTVYQNFPLENIDQLPDLIKNNKNLVGLNVTIPYKTKVLSYLNDLSDSAKSIGAVNTIKVQRGQSKIELTGYNTDEFGFRQSLMPLLDADHRKALILGTGGAAKAVEYVLSQLKISYFLVSRIPENENEISYHQLNSEIIATHKLIINTSPLGMYPNTIHCPDIPYDDITPQHILFDLIYNPAETLFMKKGMQKGARAINGLEMLHFQAERAWEIWNS